MCFTLVVGVLCAVGNRRRLRVLLAYPPLAVMLLTIFVSIEEWRGGGRGGGASPSISG